MAFIEKAVVPPIPETVGFPTAVIGHPSKVVRNSSSRSVEPEDNLNQTNDE